MASDHRRSRNLHAHVKPVTIRGEKLWSYTFPTEPCWWVDEQHHTERRALAVADFDFDDLATVVTELKGLMQYPLQFTQRREDEAREHATQLARRCLSLSWLAEIALEHLNGPSDLTDIEYMCRWNEIRAAQLLAEIAWADLLNLPRFLAIAGIREAVARPNELYLSDE